MSGTLYVVPTPIGNLEDITLRALRVLREVAVIAAEDTRRTARLLSHHGIPTPTLSFHQHNTASRVPQLVIRLQAGEDIALVSDAGTPGISDPGVELVQACIAARITVDSLPGPNASLTALVASGYPTDPVVLLGFPPFRGKARTEWLKRVSGIAGTVVFFEAPHRIDSLLTELGKYSGDRPITMGRELTKIHQEFIRGTIISVGERHKTPRGEFTVVLGPLASLEEAAKEPPSKEQLWDEFGRLTDFEGLNRRQAVIHLARKHGCRPRQVYAMLEESKKLVE